MTLFPETKKILLLFSGILLTTSIWAQQYPFQNPDLSSEERAKDLISRLTIEEKATLMCDQSDAIPRLGIKKFNWWSEALHGYANNDNVTVFPEPIGMAASFNDELLYRIFDAVSDEARAKYHQWLQMGNENKRFLSLSVWTPNVNIFRDPRWGRGQETYGEDPYLTSRMGIQVVKGLQGPADARYRKLLACAKHFAVHSGPEWSRHELNLNNLDPREFQETYLPAFKALVQEADVRQVMCAYQRLDDEPCCGSTRLLQNILRKEWGFKHIVVSDCGAITDFYTTHKVSSTPVHAASKGVLAGTDVECVWENYPYKTLPEGVEKGLIKEEDIDRSLNRVLIGRFDLGDFDDDAIVPWAQIPASVLNNEKHRNLAYEMALQTMTLLQNNNDILPLSKSARKVAIIGPNANDDVMLWGNYNGTPVRTITILDGIKTKLPGNRIFYDKGCDLVEDKVTESYFSQLSFEGKQGFKAVYWNNPDRKGETVAAVQITNPIKMTTAGQHEFAPGVKLEGFSALFEAEFTPKVTEELVFKGGATGYFELLVNGQQLQMYNNWRTLPSRIPLKVEAGKTYKIEIRFTQLNNWQANIEFDFGKEVDVDYTELINKLKGIETVVFVGGISGRLEGEEMPVSYPGFKGGDRTNIELPAVQRNCLKALKAAGKKVVFVNCSGSAIALDPETKSCDAILQAWYAGESGGQAVADVLFGDYNPSGKLPVTFYRNSDNLGDFEDYSMKGRTYRYTTGYLFPFGFGLSYTNFEIGNAVLSKTAIKDDETIDMSISVKNTGKRDGTEIVQVYVRKVNDNDGPLKTLRGFQRVEVSAGKTKIAKISLSPASFEFYDRSQYKMAVVPGEYEVYYGNSSDVKDLKTIKISISTKSSVHLPPFPAIPSKQPINSVTMGDWESFPEMKLDIPIAPGPFEPTWESIEKNYPGEPAWLREAKFGIWVHFGPQSAGESGDWYARNLYKPDKIAYENHLQRYGHPSEAGYKEVLRDWNPGKLDPAKLTKIYEDAGARFLMIQGVHHDNFDLWNSRYHPWNSVNIGPKRDLLGEWAKACRAANMRFGVTFHHEYTWWWWQTAFGSDREGDKKGVPYDGNLTLEDGKGKWWEGYDPRLLYGIDLREYKGVEDNAHQDWSPAPAGIYDYHLDYARWYTTQWALRIMDVTEHYDPDFIYTDGTVQGPFTGNGTGAGIKADAMTRVMADYYNRTLQRRGEVNTFSIVKFRHKTNGTVTTEEFGVPAAINSNEPWIAEVPVGDWFYAPGFTYDAGMMIRYIIEAIARDGNAALCISILPDGSLDVGSQKMLKEVGVWMRRNGEAVYGSRAWKIPGEGEQVNGKLKMLPGGKLERLHAEFKFNEKDFRFTVGKTGALYAFCMTIPAPGAELIIKSLGKDSNFLDKPVKSVELIGNEGGLKWKQEADGLVITCPAEMPFATSVVFKIK